MKLNPALTGFYDGFLRVAATYRNQWIQQKAYATYAASADAGIFQNKLNGSILGLGLGFYQEVEGDGDFTNTGANLSLAFNKKLGNKNLYHFLGIGFDFSYFIKQINLRNAVYGNFYETNTNFDPIQTFNYKSSSFADFGLGINYVLNIKEKHSLGAGFSFAHILSPRVSFSANANDILYRKFSFNASAQIELKKDFLRLHPLLLMQNQGPHTELLFGSYLQFILNKRNKTSIYAGLQYRMAANYKKSLGSDAIILSLRAAYKSFDFGLAYDFTISPLKNASVLQGGPELYLIYILKTKKNLNQQMSSCPKF